jgi:hypothetical protein
MLRSALCGAEQLDLVAHERGAGDVLDEDGDVDLVGERLFGVATRLVAGRVDAGQVHEHDAGHRAAHGDLHRDDLDRAHPAVGAVAVRVSLRAMYGRMSSASSSSELAVSVCGLLAEAGLDVRQRRRDLLELGRRGLLAAAARSGSSTSKPSRALERGLEAHDLGLVEALPALGAARLQRVEVAGDALLELVLRRSDVAWNWPSSPGSTTVVLQVQRSASLGRSFSLLSHAERKALLPCFSRPTTPIFTTPLARRFSRSRRGRGDRRACA